MKRIAVVFAAFLLLGFAEAFRPGKESERLVIRGRVLFPGGSRIPVETGGRLEVKLQDTSLADASAKVIAKYVGKAIRFPMAFAIKYKPEAATGGVSYSLQVTIRSKTGELLYLNDMHVPVTPLGAERTKLVDVPVILVKKSAEAPKSPAEPKSPTRVKWFELVGMDGAKAVEIIKKETGFTNVMTVPEGSPITMDYRTNRVRVFVNNRGLVTSVPSIA